MTVEELIDMLAKVDKSLQVVVQGYEGGLDDVTGVYHLNISRNVNEPEYYGRHEPTEKQGTPAVQILSNRRS